MEQGEYRVSLDTLFRILAEFKMSMGEFFEEMAEESITPRDVRSSRASTPCPRMRSARSRTSSPSSASRAGTTSERSAMSEG